MDSSLARAAALMKEFPGRWGVAGGWAIDLFLQRRSRPHGDLDLAILRNDQHQLQSLLGVASTEKVVSAGLTPWLAREELQPPVHEVHVTWPDGFHVEFLLNEQDSETGEWVFRRDARIRRSLRAAFREGPGVPYLAPEIVLLYKAKAPTVKDDADLDVALRYLEVEPRLWLRGALEVTMPGHRWAGTLSSEA